MRRALTKQDLVDMGITIQQNHEYECGFQIIHQSSLRLNTTELHPTKNTKHHKYGKDKTYYIVAWSEKGKTISFPLQRVIYAWFNGDVPADMDVDHIDNDSLNNDPYNLQLLTRKENIAKRYAQANQYTWRDVYEY